MTKYIIRGKYNDIYSENIGAYTVISGWCYIGCGVKIGKHCTISNHVDINTNAVIGDNVKLMSYVNIVSDAKIGNRVMIGAHCTLADELYMNRETEKIIRTPPMIGDDVIIGMHCSILGNVGKNSVIAANSFVKESVPDNEVWGGTPAKLLMHRTEFDRRAKHLQDTLIYKN